MTETAHYSMISRRMPSVHVPCDRLEFGSLVMFRILDESHARLPNPVAPPTPRLWERRNAREREALFHVVGDMAGCAVLHRVIDGTALILRNRAMLYEQVGLDDPDPALTGMLWKLSAMLAERGRVQRVLDELVAVRDGLPPDAEPLPDAADRITVGQARLEELTGAIHFYVDQIDALASRVHEFVEQQAAVDRYHTALRNSDFLADKNSGPVVAPSAAADLTERMAAVLAAYHELTADHRAVTGRPDPPAPDPRPWPD